MSPRERAHAATLAALAAATLLIALATLTPQAPYPELGQSHWCLACGSLGGADVVLNVMLFVPFGATLALAGVRWRVVVLAVLAFTVGIELTQLLVIPGRDATLSDVVSNTTGGVLGALAARSWRRWLLPDGHAALALASVVAGAWLGMLALTAWLLQPSVPAIQLYGQPAIDTPSFEPYTGRIGAIRVNGRTLENAPLPADSVEPFRAAHTRIDAELTAPARETREKPAAIARVGDTNVEALVLMQRGRHLVFRTRLRASDLRLRSPAIALEDGLVAPDLRPGEQLRVSAGLDDHELFASRSSVSGQHAWRLPLAATLGWAMLSPWGNVLRPGYLWLSALWIAGWLVPIGYLGARARDRRVVAASVTATTALAGLVVIPASFGLAPSSATEWAAAAIGVALGWTLGARTRG